MNPPDARAIIEDFLADPEIAPCVAHVERIPPREAVWADLPADLDPRLRHALDTRAVRRLYSHQARAYELARAGRDFVVVTPTASGKTLCYNLPVVQTLLEEPTARALYLFPTKALSQDQQAELNELALAGDLPTKVYTFDGDTPAPLRSAAREMGRIVISNPDMLHAGVLPNHTKWIRFFSNLRYVVVDEMHAYRGVFGSHVADLMRRLLRIAAFYGSRPVFIFCSATIGNPAELARSLAGRDVEELSENGAPSGERRVVFYNPPIVDPVQGIRRSTATESEKLAVRLLRSGVKTILFARSRLRVELIASYINETIANIYNDNERITVKPYRSGLLPSERRAIERGLREGSIQGVVSTNALELGIDIGGLDAAVLAGFPGSFASFWQQSGRAGRRGSISLAVFVASSSPLDQYVIEHPEYFFGRSPENARIDPDNPYIFMDHVKCAAFELPFAEDEAFGGGLAQPGEDEIGATREALGYLEEEGIVRLTGGRWYWSADGYPSEKISLRSATSDNVVIVDTTGGASRVIGEMDRPSAKELIYDDAVYIHLGRQYIVLKLDIENRTCHVVEKDVDYWTDAVVKTDIRVLTEDLHGRLDKAGRTSAAAQAGPAARYVLGDVLVRNQAEKFKKLRFHSHENVGYGEINLPPEEMQTRALVILIPPGGAGSVLEREYSGDEAFKAAVLSGVGRMLHDVAPAFLMCDPRDLGRTERIRDPHFGMPALYLYDQYPGGTGLAEGLASMLTRVVGAARERLADCGCSTGCPSCVGVDFAGGGVQGAVNLDGASVKRSACALLAALEEGMWRED
ncbi:MAG TPA: DEAD/DEAH box helicase [Rectinemataceae bacterium]|nr:DEAD/DEAH box helicase [Rectinemataceae bacterium]